MDGSSGAVGVPEPGARPVRAAGTNALHKVRSGRASHPIGSTSDRLVLGWLAALVTLLALVWIVVEGTMAGGIDTGIYPTAGLP